MDTASETQPQMSMNLYALLVANSVLMYDHVATLTEEITFIWCCPKAPFAILFLVNRYFALLSNIYVLSINSLPGSESCPKYLLSRELLIFVQQIIVCFMLTLRTYALYGCSKRLITWMVIISFALVGLALAGSSGHSLSTAVGVPGFGCYESYTTETAVSPGLAWASLFVYELLIFALTVFRICNTKGLSLVMSRRNILDIIFQDGAIYFVAMTVFNIPNILTFYCGSDTIRGSLATFTSCMSVTLISRLVLNLHKPIDTGISSSLIPDDDSGSAVLTSRVNV
ncbi:hypothetical protein DEU56DRAFT_826099 [Suillus clintonianus]|uniref:uncharacterized protein n=1 Tax=Suillus clintonianus TaxID=1904413 RepID=UPI001B87DDA4|nr:uncharacterized protein DEU56DRAFT_826099 [Suillus clintonianus]KAG2125041.1 hypothetical protein DEU56DRAFT_826099 [Suillus clintonianus]